MTRVSRYLTDPAKKAQFEDDTRNWFRRSRARLGADPLGRKNYGVAQKEEFLSRQGRTFLKLTSAPHGDGA